MFLFWLRRFYRFVLPLRGANYATPIEKFLDRPTRPHLEPLE